MNGGNLGGRPREIWNLTAKFFPTLELPLPERRPMDQETPLDNEKTVRSAYFARRNPAIDRLSVSPNHLRKFRYRQVLASCGHDLGLLPAAHDRLSSQGSDALLIDEFLLTAGEH